MNIGSGMKMCIRDRSRTGIRNTKIQFNHSVRCMENRKDFMHLFSLGKGDLWNRQKSRQWTKNSVRISKKNRKNHLQRGNSFQQNEQGNHDG